MTDVEKYAEALNGIEYGTDWKYDDIFTVMKSKGLVAVFGYSDDLMEFRGAVNDETGISKVFFGTSGIIVNECDCGDACPNWDTSKLKFYVEGHFAPEWCHASHVYTTNIPSSEFYMMEDGELYCIGIVFDLNSCKE